MGQAVTPVPLVAGDADEQPFTGAGDLTPAPALRGVPSPPTVGARHDAARRRRRARLVRAGAVAGVLAVAGAAAGAALVLRDGDGEAVAVPADGLAAAGNRLWVVGGEGDDARLVAFGLPDGRPSEGAPEEPTGVVAVASDGRSTWALNEEGVHRLALEGAGLRHEIDGWPVAVEVEVDRVWLLDVVDEDLVLGSFEIDGGPEASAEEVGPAGEDGEQAWRGALAVEDGEVWVTDGRRTLARRLPDQSRLEPVRVDGDVVDLAIDGPFVWAGTRDGRLLRIDRVSRDVTRVPVGRLPLVEVVAGGGMVWTADEEGLVRRVAGDIPEARAALTLDGGRKVLALGDDSTVLYVANAETGVVDQVDAISGEIDTEARIDLTDALG
jgi:hypothetical protein